MQTGSTKRTPNILYAGFREDFVTGELVSDAGDNVGGKPDLYNVFILRLHTGTGVGGISPNATTWFNRPQRDVAVAAFTLDHRRIVETTANEKSLHGFLFGPGGAASAETLGEPFACPPVAEQIAYEVAGAVRKGAGGAMNIGGHSGLGISLSPSFPRSLPFGVVNDCELNAGRSRNHWVQESLVIFLLVFLGVGILSIF